MPDVLIPTLLRDLVSLPTAPFVEGAVAEYVRSCCGRLRHVTLTADRYGNLLAHYRNQPPRRPAVVFTAHMDHPGFEALEMAGKGRLRAAFRGWVEPEYFEAAGVRFWSGGRWLRGKIYKVTKAARVYRMIGRTARPEEVLVDIKGDVAPGSAGMWDLGEPVLRRGCVHARACDDLAGCASMLALLERLSSGRVKAECYCLFTRAEEVGFVGAIAAAREGTIPRELPVVAIETSKALPSAPIGAGPVLRVGDKSSVFTPEVTEFCDRVAMDLAQRDRSFAFQRKLMDGGTCESTAYYVYGYKTTGVCVPLGNYHNMDTVRRRIAAEYISLSDWQRMVQWFEAIVTDREGYRSDGGNVRKTINERFEKYLPLLRASSPQSRPAAKSARRGRRSAPRPPARKAAAR